MKRLAVAAVMLCGALSAEAAKVSCDDDLPHVLSVGVPRTSMSDAETARLPQLLQAAFAPAYIDKCGAGKDLQIHLAFGSDYEVLDWLERGSVDAGIVPHLSLFLLTNRNQNVLKELDAASSAGVGILRPLAPAPACRRFANGRWTECDPAETLNAFVDAIIAGEDPGKTRLMFASHLSSTGFLYPIEQTAKKLAALKPTDAEAEAFWQRFFAAARFRLDSVTDVDPFILALEEEKLKGDLTVVAYPGEETLLLSGQAPIANGRTRGYQQHFVISAEAAQLLPKATFVEPWNEEQPSIDPSVTAILARENPPEPFAQLVHASPTFGTRIFAFTIRESLRLLKQQQRSSGLAELALVLPGGGVKAAYQSRIIDFLYGHRLLRNAQASGSTDALVVRSVLGTSGGALLGYFVSQLGSEGPFRLLDILWKPGGELLNAENVFGWTDMLRYVSIAWTFAIFCIVLAVVTGRHSSRFYERSRPEIGAWRVRLLTVFAVFLAVPVLIRFATRSGEIEHVPVIEGLFYSILTVLVMFADQCLIHVSEGREQRKLRWQVLVLAAVGALFVFAALLGVSWDTLQKPIAFGFAFLTLAAIFLGAPLLVLYASGRFGDARHRIADVVGSLAAVLLLCAFGMPGRLPRQVPHILALLVLIGLAVGAYLHSQNEKRKRIVATLLTFFTLLSTAVLCWSEEVRPSSWKPSLSFLTASAFENTAAATFLASTGCLLLVMAAMVWVYQNKHFALRDGEEFALALGTLVGHSVVTSLLVFATAMLLPGSVHNLEMTGSFWVALTITGAVLAGAVLYFAPRRDWMDRAVRFLRSEHPNGALVPRRYARMLAVAGVSVIWWNVMVAPALYGNRVARRYLDEAVVRFDQAFRAARREPPSDAIRGFVPTARFVTPANTLDVENSTRYFLFEVPDRTPPAPRKRIAGALWNMYETTPQWLGDNDCRYLIDAGCVSFVHDVIFSSGSPFPIFAAHRVHIPGEKEAVFLIDGGYSNVIPIDAARQIAARQALIVHSSSPFSAKEHTKAKTLSLSPGMLIRNAGRLPAFMFERGQQVDRISRQDLFVISVAPRLEPGEAWPGLAQFDEATVQSLFDKANANLYERIGFVESWGEPRFRFSRRIAGAAPATPAGPG